MGSLVICHLMSSNASFTISYTKHGIVIISPIISFARQGTVLFSAITILSLN